MYLTVHIVPLRFQKLIIPCWPELKSVASCKVGNLLLQKIVSYIVKHESLT